MATVLGETAPLGAAVVQRAITMKDNGTKSSGNLEQLAAEVDATVVGNDLQDLKATIGQLAASIAQREFEQSRHERFTDTWWDHQHRITEEKAHRDRLVAARDAHPDYVKRGRKKKVTAGGWTTY